MKYILVIFILCYCLLFAVISEYEVQILENMLEREGLSLNSLNFPKDWAFSEFKIPKMIEILNNPMQYPIFVDQVKEILLEKEIIKFFDFSADTVFNGVFSEMSFCEIENKKAEIPFYTFIDICHTKLSKIKSEKDILEYVEYVYEISNRFWTHVLKDLNTIELSHLEVFLLLTSKGGIESEEKYEILLENVEKLTDDTEIEYYVELFKKINFYAMISSAQYFYAGMKLLSDHDTSRLSFGKPVIRDTKYGRMIVGTKDHDVYDESISQKRNRVYNKKTNISTVFVYDPGGNDTYSFDISTNINRPFLSIIDLSGDDCYRNNNIGQLFNAMFGMIYHFDGSGNDFYYGDDLAFSANVGTLISIDAGGNDTYIAGSKSLGAGTLGIALLVNIGGNNYFSGTCMTQGFAGTLGMGLLASFADDSSLNNDVYFSGGRYRHAPLVPDDYRSMSQGFGYGFRPDVAGGIGILFDESGNDQYIGGVYAQGGAYWYALGILIDLTGNDVYRAVYYPQGSGIHMAAGFLYDEGGDDSYYSRFGPGQGAGHDYGVGFLIDKQGNDHYSIDGGNGIGLANSVGIFIDSAGDDRYERKRKDSYGFANNARNSGSIGLFLDTGGNDIYANELMDDDISWANGIFGFGLDKNEELEEIHEENLVDELFEDEASQDYVDPLLNIKELFAIASEWEVGSALNRVRDARKLLIERDIESADYIFEQKLHTKSGLEMRAILELAQNSDYMKQKLSDGLQHEHSRAIRNTIYIIGELADSSFLEIFEKMLEEELYVSSILSALGNIKTEKSVDLLEKYIDTNDIYVKVTLARSLLSINSDRSIELLLKFKDDDCFLIMSMIKLYMQ